MKSFPPNGGECYQLQGLHNISSRWWVLWGQTCDFTYYKYTWLDFLQLSPKCHFVLPLCKHGALRENTSIHLIIQMLFVCCFNWAFYDIRIKGHLQMTPAFCFCLFFFFKTLSPSFKLHCCNIIAFQLLSVLPLQLTLLTVIISHFSNDILSALWTHTHTEIAGTFCTCIKKRRI